MHPMSALRIARQLDEDGQAEEEEDGCDVGGLGVDEELVASRGPFSRHGTSAPTWVYVERRAGMLVSHFWRVVEALLAEYLPVFLGGAEERISILFSGC